MLLAVWYILSVPFIQDLV